QSVSEAESSATQGELKNLAAGRACVRFVLDASVALNWLFADGTSASNTYANNALGALANSKAFGLAPATWWLEVSNVIAKAENRRAISPAQSEAFLELIAGLDIEPDSATTHKALAETLQLARRYRLSSYDASYLEVALRAGLPLATLDDDLRKVALKAGVKP